jgi:hypothetical protein
MSPAADPATAEDQLVDRVIAAIRSALAGDGEAFSRLIREHVKAPDVLGVITTTACIALFSRATRLRERIKELEDRPTLEYKGVYDPETLYHRGNAVTKGGSLWIALTASTGATPGVSVDCWRLAVKAGRDGKDAR